MANIFEIGEHLKAIFDELEENGGELTEELAADLEITENNFRDKIESYCQVITMYKSDIDCCKEEKDRVNSIQKVKKNIVDRIVSKLLDAVKMYGETGKSGNKIITLPTRKLYTTSRTSVNEFESRKGKLAYYFISYLKELNQNGVLELGEETDINGLLGPINAIAKSEYETPDEFGNTPIEEFIPYTIADLQAVKLDISNSISFYDLLTSRSKFGYLLANDELSFSNTELDKDIAKAILQDDPNRLTVGELVKKDSLTIK